MTVRKCKACNNPGRRCQCRKIFLNPENKDTMKEILIDTKTRLTRESCTDILKKYKNKIYDLYKEFKKEIKENKSLEIIQFEKTQDEFGFTDKDLGFTKKNQSIESRIFIRDLKDFILEVEEKFHNEAVKNHKENNSKLKYYKTDKGRKAIRRGQALRDKRFRYASIGLSEKEKEEMRDFYANCPEGYEVDHIIPISKGGRHCMDNLQYLTREENRKKFNKMPIHSEKICEN